MSDADDFDELLTEFEKAHGEGKLRDDDYDRLVKTAQIHQKNMSKQEAITFINGMVEDPENHDIEDVEEVIQEAFDNGTIGQFDYDTYMQNVKAIKKMKEKEKLTNAETTKIPNFDFNVNDFAELDFGVTGKKKIMGKMGDIKIFYKQLGLDPNIAENEIKQLLEKLNKSNSAGSYKRWLIDDFFNQLKENAIVALK